MSGSLVIFLKETKDILRDRRSVVSMILVPMLFYPVLSIGLGSVISSQIEKTFADRQSVLALPTSADPALLASLSQQTSILVVPGDSIHDLFLRAASSGSPFDPRAVDQLFSAEFSQLSDSSRQSLYAHAIASKWVRAVIELPAEFNAGGTAAGPDTFRVYADEEDVSSGAAAGHLETWMQAVRDSIVEETLAGVGVDRQVLTPFGWSSTNVASLQKQSGKLLALFLPYFLIILTMTGGMYPALDITAGEKERQTLESLLVAPVSRMEIAIGKFLAVFLAGMVSMILATVSMVISSGMGGSAFAEGGASLPYGLGAATASWIVLLMIPTAMLFSSLLIAVSISARSFREGQSYVTPLLLVIVIPATVSFVPGIELNWPLTVVPVVNLCLAMKEVLLGTHSIPLTLAVFAATTIYAVFMLYVASRIFERESVLFRT